MLPSVLLIHVSVNGRPSKGETIIQDAVELTKFTENCFSFKLSCIKASEITFLLITYPVLSIRVLSLQITVLYTHM